MADNSNAFRLFWPEIDDPESAKAASRLGVSAAGLYSIATAAIVTYRLMNTHEGISLEDAVGYLDAVIFAVLALGIYGLWRSAAIAALVLFLAEQVMAGMHAHAMVGLIVPVVLTLFLISGVRGTVLFHKFSRVETPSGDA